MADAAVDAPAPSPGSEVDCVDTTNQAGAASTVAADEAGGATGGASPPGADATASSAVDAPPAAGAGGGEAPPGAAPSGEAGKPLLKWQLKEIEWTQPDRVAAVRAGAAAELEGWPEQDDYTIERFLLARGGKVNKAVAMVKEYLVWRRKHTPDFPISFHPSTIPNELAANKAFIHPPTKAGNPVGVVLARRHFKNKNKGEAERFIVYTMDQLIARMPEGVTRFVAIFDLKGFKFKNMDVATTKALVRILELVFAERLAAGYIVNESGLFWTLWKMISPLVDKRTLAKIHFMGKKRDKLIQAFGKENLWTEFGGEWQFDFTDESNMAPWPGTVPLKVNAGGASSAEVPTSTLTPVAAATPPAEAPKPKADTAGARKRGNWFKKK